MTINTGFTFENKKQTTREHLEALLVLAQEQGWDDVAAATDNLLDVLKRKAAEVKKRPTVTVTRDWVKRHCNSDADVAKFYKGYHVIIK